MFDMVVWFMSYLLLDVEGLIYVYFNFCDVLDGSVVWNGGVYKLYIYLEDCWGLCCGCIYEYGCYEVNFCCEYVELYDGCFYYCFLILVYGEIVGLMYLWCCEIVSNKEFYKCKKLV